MTTMNIFDMTDLWDASGTTFAGIKLNVTDTASASGSLLMDLQVGGASIFSVRRAFFSGTGKLDRAVIGLPQFSYVHAALGGNLQFGNNETQNNFVINLGINAGVELASGCAYGWTSNSTNAVAGTRDLALFRDAANTLAQRNGVNAQLFRVYSSYTDVSNYSMLSIAGLDGGGRYLIQARNAGTGIARSINIKAGAGQSVVLAYGTTDAFDFSENGLRFGADNFYDIGAAANNRPRNVFQAGYWQTSEMTAPAAPAANGVRIYAEDDGAGKTRLMALFATGVAQQIAIEP